MSKAVMETAAEKYRRLKKAEDAGETLHDVECPSGMVFKCRKVTVPFLIAAGMLPMHLVEAMQQASGNGTITPAQAFAAMPFKEQMHSIEFSAKVVKYVCVEPRIVEKPIGPNDLGQDELMLQDFHAIMKWAMNGGDEAARLETFRSE